MKLLLMAPNGNVCEDQRPLICSFHKCHLKKDHKWKAELSSGIQVEYGGDWSLWSEFMTVFLQRIQTTASLQYATLGIYYRESKRVPIKPIKWPQISLETTQERRNTQLKQGQLISVQILLHSKQLFFLPYKSLYSEHLHNSADGHISSWRHRWFSHETTP